jgi:hypothetical protein
MPADSAAVFSRSLRIVALVLLVAAPLPGHAAEPRFLGPLRIRDLSPISMLRLDFAPAHAVDDEQVRAIRVNYSHANVYIVSGAADEFLIERNSDSPLSGDDVRAMLSREGNVFFFDGELSLVEIEYIHSLTPSMQVQVAWPLHIHGGGFLDRTIEGFHDATGLGRASRHLMSRNDMHVVARLGDDELVMIERGTRAGHGDPTISLRHASRLGRGMSLVAEAAVKIPAGDPEHYFSSGHSDMGVQLSLQKQFERNALYLGGSWVRVGDTRLFPNFALTDAQSISLAWEYAFSGMTWGIVQGSWGRGAFRGAETSSMTDDRNQISLGLRRRLSDRSAVTFALTENVIHFKNTPDIGIHLGVGFLLRKQ